jgi:hypothetical protein
MGHKHVDSLKEGATLAATKERVGENEITGKGKSTANVAETCPKVPEQEGRGETQEPPIVAPVKAPRSTYAEALNSRPVRGTRNSRVKSERATRPLTLLK